MFEVDEIQGEIGFFLMLSAVSEFTMLDAVCIERTKGNGKRSKLGWTEVDLNDLEREP